MEHGSEPVVAEHKSRHRRRLWASSAVGLCAVLFATYFHRPLFEGNWGVVDEGRVYRSAQPKGDVVGLIKSHKLASVINLRGGKIEDPWYVAEVEATAKTGAEFYDLPMSPVKRPSRRELLVLLDLLDHCKYPILIHCKSGSDRTGLVVGLYRMYRRSEPPTLAVSSFSLSHGHIPLLGPEHLHEPFDEYAAWLSQTGQNHSPELLVDWVKHHYVTDDPLTAFSPAHPGPRTPHQTARTSETPIR